MTKQNEGGDPLPENINLIRRKLTGEDIEKIRTEKKQILEKYKWMQGEFLVRLASSTFEIVRSFEDVYRLFETQDKYAEEKIGKTLYKLCIEFNFFKKAKLEKDEVENLKTWNNIFVQDMKRLVYLRALVPKTKKLNKAA